MLVRPHF